MKIASLVILTVLVISVLSVYLFIPSTLTVSTAIIMNGNTAGVGRVFYNKDMWTVIAQGNKHFDNSYSLNRGDFFWYTNDTFHFDGFLLNTLQIKIKNRKNEVLSELSVLPAGQDSVMLRWIYEVETSNNPFVRIQQYRDAVDTKNNLTVITNRLKNFLSNSRNIYGYQITQVSTKDTFLISTKEVLKDYPSTEQIYMLINKLRRYVKETNAGETGYPMMNVSRWDSIHYSVMIALPVNKRLNDEGNIIHKQMIPGHFLTTTVAGGNQNINNAYAQLQQYLQDYNRTSMAIPFLYLVTDRSREKDSSKWVTKLYFPVM